MSFDEPRPEIDTTVQPRTSADREIRCRACGHPVARERDAIEVEGRHVRVFVNPAGETFEIGCFRDAPGCTAWGPAETFWSWFPGHAWTVALCGRCKTHLGWSYQRAGSIFHGLILPRLK